MNFIVRDNSNKIYQTFWYVSEERELHILNNIIKIYNITKQDININFVSDKFDPTQYLGPNWKNNQDLYDKLVIDFNSLGGEILTAWNADDI